MSAPTTASVEELLPAAIELAERTGAVPSINRLTKTYRIGQPKAKALYRRLQTEVAKRGSRRARKQAELTRKTPARRVVEARVFDPAVVPVSPGVGPVGPWAYAVPARAPEEVPTSLEAPRPDAPVEPIPSQVKARKRRQGWPLIGLALPAFVAIWSGWVGLGGLTGFGVVHPLPGIADQVSINTAITLPIGLESYAAYALYAWLSGAVSARARKFAMWSSLISLLLGAGGQITYHLLVSTGPWLITTIVACLPVAVLGMGAALYHLVHTNDEKES